MNDDLEPFQAGSLWYLRSVASGNARGDASGALLRYETREAAARSARRLSPARCPRCYLRLDGPSLYCTEPVLHAAIAKAEGR